METPYAQNDSFWKEEEIKDLAKSIIRLANGIENLVDPDLDQPASEIVIQNKAKQILELLEE